MSASMSEIIVKIGDKRLAKWTVDAVFFRIKCEELMNCRRKFE
ncbi:hypothetical protein D8I24_1795 [Cupriavidus necator H850]|nr:hypothetical protein D8I24_1795 [Cupriavidus necator H850]